MFNFKRNCVVFILVISAFFSQNSIEAYVTSTTLKMNDVGDTIATWQDDQNTGYFNVVAAVLPAGSGTWSTPVTISTGGGLNASIPKVGINDSGNIVVVWTAFNVSLGFTSLYGNTLTGLTTWGTATQISDNTEHVNQDYDVRLSDNDDFVITWSGYSFVTFDSIIRTIYGTFGTWPTAVTLAP